ncbi:MAG: hypothetical protein KDA64_04645 [Rhodospirillaceae bacterium]|nr:hypothetical protein [Rhodospirillaceae bacterium]
MPSDPLPPFDLGAHRVALLARELRDRISTAAVGLDPDDDPALAAASMLALSEHLQAGIVTCEAIAQRRGAHD